jgi:hypothetical protein
MLLENLDFLVSTHCRSPQLVGETLAESETCPNKLGIPWSSGFRNNICLQAEIGAACPIGYAITMPRRKTSADYHTLAEKRGFRWLGHEVPNIQTKTHWGCEEGHQWEGIYNSIQRRTGCLFCTDNLPKTPEDYKALAQERGLRWLDRARDAPPRNVVICGCAQS